MSWELVEQPSSTTSSAASDVPASKTKIQVHVGWTMQLFNWCEGFAGRRVIPEEVGVPAAAGGAAARAARGHRQGGGGLLVAQQEHHHHHHPHHHHRHHPGGSQPQLPRAPGGRVHVFLLIACIIC